MSPGVMAVSAVVWDMAGPGGLGCLVSRFTPVHTTHMRIGSGSRGGTSPPPVCTWRPTLWPHPF